MSRLHSAKQCQQWLAVLALVLEKAFLVVLVLAQVGSFIACVWHYQVSIVWTVVWIWVTAVVPRHMYP